MNTSVVLVNISIVLLNTAVVLVNTSRIFWKSSFLESVSFHSQMLQGTNFGLVLGDCIVVEIIFINKYIIKLIRICFFVLFLFSTIPIVIIWVILEKLCLVFSSSKAIKNVQYEKSKTYTACMSQIFYYSPFSLCLWQKKPEFHSFRISLKNPIFWKVFLFNMKVIVWLFLHLVVFIIIIIIDVLYMIYEDQR